MKMFLIISVNVDEVGHEMNAVAWHKVNVIMYQEIKYMKRFCVYHNIRLHNVFETFFSASFKCTSKQEGEKWRRKGRFCILITLAPRYIILFSVSAL